MPASASERPQGEPSTLARLGAAVLALVSAAVVLLASARPPKAPPPLLTATASLGNLPPPRLPPPEREANAVEPAGPDEEASCSIPDRGAGRYGAPVELSVGTLIVPEPPPKDDYRLLLHLHGGAAVRKVVAPMNLEDLVVVTVDAGVGSKVYGETFGSPEVLETLLAEVDDKLRPAKLEHLILSSWSAGYGGVRQILSHHPASVSALVLLDSVHASYDQKGEPQRAGLEPFFTYAERARAGEATLVWTHSDIRPPGYAATGEVADLMLEEVGGRRSYGGLTPTFGVELKTVFDDGGLHLRGFTGTGKSAHCAHVKMIGTVLERDVLPALP